MASPFLADADGPVSVVRQGPLHRFRADGADQSRARPRANGASGAGTGPGSPGAAGEAALETADDLSFDTGGEISALAQAASSGIVGERASGQMRCRNGCERV